MQKFLIKVKSLLWMANGIDINFARCLSVSYREWNCFFGSVACQTLLMDFLFFFYFHKNSLQKCFDISSAHRFLASQPKAVDSYWIQSLCEKGTASMIIIIPWTAVFFCFIIIIIIDKCHSETNNLFLIFTNWKKPEKTHHHVCQISNFFRLAIWCDTNTCGNMLCQVNEKCCEWQCHMWN